MGNIWEWLFRKFDMRSMFSNLIFVTFVLAQCLDGILTYIGVRAWGLDAEANPIVGWAMSIAGVGLGLVAVKLVAVMGGLFLYYQCGAHNIIMVLTVFYLAIAVLPWIHLFLTI